MELHQVLDEVEVDNAPSCWEECWPEAAITYPGVGFVNRQLVDLAGTSTQLDQGFLEALDETIRLIRSSESLLRLAWLWHVAFFDRAASDVNSWPIPGVIPDKLKGMWSTATLITGLPRLLEMHRALGIPEQVTRDTLYDIALWSRHYHSVHGQRGLDELEWLQHHFLGKLFRLGRLEFVAISYRGGYRIYRNKQTGQSVAVAETGTKFRRDGLIDGTTGVTDPDSWDSLLLDEEAHVRGGIVLPEGRATCQRIELRTGDWDVLFEKGTGLLDVHIPADGPLTPEGCLESYRMANEFYPRVFPDHSYTGFVCNSWLLDPELAKILPAESNIVQFQREFYLLPTLSDDRQTWERVFGARPDDLAKAPRDSSLRRAILDHVLAGGRFSKGYGFIPADEIGKKHRYYGRD